MLDGSNAPCWEADELAAGSPIDDNLKRDLLGARRKIIFVEGTESSLDRALYSILFPMASVIPKGNCHEVEEAVAGARSAEALHWLRAYGIIDSDGVPLAYIAAKRDRGVYALPYYSVEAVYFHPKMIQRVATRVVSTHGGDAQQLVRDAVAAGVAAIRNHTERLSRKAAKKMARRSVMERIPGDDDLLNASSNPLVIPNESNRIHSECRQRLESAVASGDWETILATCSIRESSALEDVSRILLFRKRKDYERAVRHLLSEDENSRDWARELFGDLAAQILV